MCLLGDGSAAQPAKVAISRYVAENGTASFATRRNSNVRSVPNREFQPLGYDDIYRHLEGKDPNGRDVVGVYAILPDSTCRFLCCDFDDKKLRVRLSEGCDCICGRLPRLEDSCIY